MKHISALVAVFVLVFSGAERLKAEEANIFPDPLVLAESYASQPNLGCIDGKSSSANHLFVKKGEDPWGWTRRDVNINISASILHVVDGLQTMEATERLFNDRMGYREGNFILGERPSKTEVGLYMVGSLIVVNYATTLIPKPWRYVLQSVWIGVELHCVTKYYRMGVTGFRF